MVKKHLKTNLPVLFTICVAFMSIGQLAVAGENKDAEDAVFNEPKGDNSFVQIVLGIGDYIAQDRLKEVQSPGSKAVGEAEEALDEAKSNAEDSAEREAQLKAYTEQRNELQKLTTRSAEEERALKKIKKKILDAKAEPILSKSERAAAIEKAETNLSKARAAALKGKIGSRAIKSVVIAGRVLLIIDLAGRFYIWNVMDANPTLTPVGTYMWHYAKKAFESDKHDKNLPSESSSSSNSQSKPSANEAR
jgi:hypothetical protein